MQFKYQSKPSKASITDTNTDTINPPVSTFSFYALIKDQRLSFPYILRFKIMQLRNKGSNAKSESGIVHKSLPMSMKCMFFH